MKREQRQFSPVVDDIPDSLRRALAALDAETAEIERGLPREVAQTLQVCGYAAIENRTGRKVVWRAKLRPQTCRYRASLRRRLTAAQAANGMTVQDGQLDRPNAGLPVVGPLPLPEPRPRVSLACPGKHNVSPDFDMPKDQLYIPGFNWYFRAEGIRRILARKAV